MRKINRKKVLAMGLVALVMGATAGCQTHIAGMTLPSGHYLEHPPQYFAPSPFFPLSKELGSMENQGNNAQAGTPGNNAAPLPAPLPGPGPLPN